MITLEYKCSQCGSRWESATTPTECPHCESPVPLGDDFGEVADEIRAVCSQMSFKQCTVGDGTARITQLLDRLELFRKVGK